MAGMAWKLKLNWIKFSYFSCRGKREFSYIDLIQITLLITTDGLLKRICQPDIKFYVYLCINVLRDIRRSKGNIVASVSLIRLEGNVEILQILVVCEEYWFKWWIRVRNIYIYSFINFDVIGLYVTVLYFLTNTDICAIWFLGIRMFRNCKHKSHYYNRIEILYTR